MIALIRCWSVQNLLDLYVDGRLAAPQAAKVKAHIESCEDCKAEAEELMPLDRSIFEEIKTPEGLKASILEAYEKDQSPAPAVPWTLQPAQGLALLYCALLTGLNARPAPHSAKGLSPVPTSAHTAVETPREVRS